MENEKLFKARDYKGDMVECEELFHFLSTDGKLKYLVYTDNTDDENEDTRIYALRTEVDKPDEPGVFVESEEEWDLIDEHMDLLRNPEADYDESEGAIFTIEMEDGVEMECELICCFEDEESGKTYLLYTDGTFDDEGTVNVFAGQITDDDELLPVETDEEWDMLSEALEAFENEMDEEEEAEEE